MGLLDLLVIDRWLIGGGIALYFYTNSLINLCKSDGIALPVILFISILPNIMDNQPIVSFQTIVITQKATQNQTFHLIVPFF